MKLAFDEDKRKYDERGDSTGTTVNADKGPKSSANMMLRS
jgi:hypothetical protein